MLETFSLGMRSQVLSKLSRNDQAAEKEISLSSVSKIKIRDSESSIYSATQG